MAYPLVAGNLRHILLSLLPSPEIKLAGQQLRVSNHLDMIGNLLWAINSVIMDANLRAAKEPEIKMWLRDVTAAVVDVENILETIQDSFQQPKEQKQEVITSLISYGSISSTTRHDILVDLKQISTSLNYLLSTMVAFDLQIDVVDSMDPNHADYYSILEQEVVGRDNDIKEILQIIFRLKHRQTLEGIYGNVPFFTAITGEPGVGKSILARMVYHHPIVCKVFRHRIWVDVLNSTFLSFDHKQIGRECVRHLTGRISSDIDIWNLLHRSIPQTRLLLVLDGFSSITKENADKLVELKRKLFSLDEDIIGNKVIITCHSTMGKNYLDEEYKLKNVSQDAWTKLFLRYAVPRTQFDQAKHNFCSIRMTYLLNKAKELYHKEQNSIPFEAKKLGSILRHTRMSDYDFQKAYQLMTVHYATHEFTQIIMYDVLFQPLPLIFHNHRLDMLIAEGTFNYSSNSQRKFQGDVVTWINQLHGTKEVFDALLSYIRKSIYHSTKMDVQKFKIPQQCRYACVLVDSNTSTLLTNLEPKIANNLRMLMLYKAKDEMDLQLEKDREALSIKIPKSLFKNLIILSIIDTHIQQLPKTISMLYRLRYLNISEKEIEELPNSICDLHNLCVLSLSRCKKLLELPEQIHKLTKLHILRLAYCTRLQKLPNSVTSLVSLQMLDVEACHWLKELPKDLIYLERLTSLNMIGCASVTQIPIVRLANLEALLGYIIDHDNSSLILMELRSRTDFEQLHLRHLERMEDQYSSLLLYLKKNIYLESLLMHCEWWNKDAMEGCHRTFFENADISENDFSCLKSLEIISIPVWPFRDVMDVLRECKERIRMELEQMERERMELEQMEREQMERMERERMELEQMEREQMEREQMERMVHQQMEREPMERMVRQRMERMVRMERMERMKRMELEQMERKQMEREQMERMVRLRMERMERMERMKRMEREQMEREQMERMERELMALMKHKKRISTVVNRMDLKRLKRMEREQMERVRMVRQRMERVRMVRQLMERMVLMARNVKLLPHLVEMRLVNLKSCKALPLQVIQPSLAILEISGMDAVTNVDDIHGIFDAILEISGMDSVTNVDDIHGIFAILEMSGMDSLANVDVLGIFDGLFSFSGLVKLILSEMPSLLKWNLRCPCLQQLTLIQCPKLMELFGFELKNKLAIWLQSELLGQYSIAFQNTFKNIEELEIVGCHEMRQLPQDIMECKHLRTLSIIRCSKLHSIPDWLQQMPSLEQIFLAGCTRISCIPEEIKQRLKNNIIVQGCSKL